MLWIKNQYNLTWVSLVDISRCNPLLSGLASKLVISYFEKTQINLLISIIILRIWNQCLSFFNLSCVFNIPNKLTSISIFNICFRNMWVIKNTCKLISKCVTMRMFLFKSPWHNSNVYIFCKACEISYRCQKILDESE